MDAKKKELPWEYCECGCKSHCFSVGRNEFSVYNDLKGGYWFVEGHGARLFGKRYDSWEAIDKIVLAKLKSIKVELDRYVG